MSYENYMNLMKNYAGSSCPELLLRTHSQFDDKQLIANDILIALQRTSGYSGKTTLTKACNLAIYANVYLNLTDVLRCDGFEISNVENFQEILNNSHIRCI